MLDIQAFRTSFYQHIEASEHIVITAHLSPDDDSLGSVMALHEILTTRYPSKDIRILYEGVPSDRHASFVRYSYIEFVGNLGEVIGETDLLIVLDVNNIARVTSTPDMLRSISCIIIDHHASSPDESILAHIDPTYSSNAELVYMLLGSDTTLTYSLAESVLLGILGDTGNLAYVSPQNTHVFETTKLLVETVGMSINAFRARYGGIPVRIMPLLQELAQHTTFVQIEGWPDMQYTYIADCGVNTDEDMSAASHIYMGQYLPKVEGYGWGIVVTPRTDGSTRISGRSLAGSVNVRDMFERMSIGGGHDRASGAKMDAVSVNETVDRLFAWMKENKPKLG